MWSYSNLLFLFFLICSAKSQKTQVSYCTPIGPCEPGKCCRTIANGLFGDIGTCEDLPGDGEPCSLNCPCADGFKCTVNPLCLKCNPMCMKNFVIKKLNFYLNNICFGNCTESFFNHLFRPAATASGRCREFKKEGEGCNEYCRCENGTYCAKNILCKQCDDVCMHGQVVDSLISYFNKGCIRNCAGMSQKFSKVSVTKFSPNKIRFDAKGSVIFPELNAKF